MKTHRVIMAVATVGISVMAVSSCAYDPYYRDHSRHSGYGYGNRSFSTVHFVRTSNPRWGYDPRVRCYYDYHKRCYYDPYLNGYYPVGYQPVYVRGVPHPHGWNSGHRYIAPPIRVRDYRLEHYSQREQSYRRLNQDWSRHIHTADRKQDHYSYQRSDSESGYFNRNDHRRNDVINERSERESQQRVIRERDDRNKERKREAKPDPWIHVSQHEKKPAIRESREAKQHEATAQFERPERQRQNFGDSERSSRRESALQKEESKPTGELSEERMGRPGRNR